MLLLFFLSGAAGLIYEVTWARSLGLIFGASHLAVTTVLAVYMGGQALGSATFGRIADRSQRPLRLYGLLEVGVGASALVFLGLTRIYPWLYPPLARLAEENGVYLTAVRTTFAVLAMIVPTTLMGGTLPVLTRFASGRGGGVARQLSHLYAFNTAGAVAGTLAAGFLLIRSLGVTATLLVGAAVSAAVGAVSVLLQGRMEGAEPVPPDAGSPAAASAEQVSAMALRMTLLGTAVSGFCALGYEVLWTRMLTLVVGTSVYSFTVMLVAFLAGIGAGSHAFSLLGRAAARPRRAVLALGVTQVLIGLSALTVTVLMRELPSLANRLQALLIGGNTTEFAGRLGASFGVGIAFMFVPAFFMGLAFPVASAAWSGGGRAGVGTSIGRLLTANTVGAILGAVVSGFVLIYVFGIERSLQILVILNVGVGLAVAASPSARRWAVGVPVVATAIAVAVRAAFPSWGRAWDERYFATYVNYTRSIDTPEEAQKKLANVQVLYYHEGVNETVSVTRFLGGQQSFVVNGRPEASTNLMDVQVQRTLGHLPMLLHPNPRRVFVLGTGTGMTLGATSIHPEVERLVLGEIEAGVLGVARTFAKWNHDVLENPKLKIVFNDGRNYLSTTKEKFDVITADPIHPWSGGAGYLYTAEYFRSVADRLAPGGIACQWLPVYELTVNDVRTVVRTFAASFKYSYIWLTFYDAVLIGSNDPIVIDEAALAKRMGVPSIRDDLALVQMGTPEDLLSFFLAGTAGARAFGRGGDVNTDDNVVLEFSAPASQGVLGLDGKNVLALSAAREDLLPYLAPAPAGPERAAQVERWMHHFGTARLFDEAHGRFLLGERDNAGFLSLLAELRARDPQYAPTRFLVDSLASWARGSPELVRFADFAFRTDAGGRDVIRISAVRQFLNRGRVLVSLVDNDRREIYGQRLIDGEDGQYEKLDAEVVRFVDASLSSLAGAARRVAASDGLPREPDLAQALRREAAQVVGRLPTASPR